MDNDDGKEHFNLKVDLCIYYLRCTIYISMEESLNS